jgi:hypothetical protein
MRAVAPAACIDLFEPGSTFYPSISGEVRIQGVGAQVRVIDPARRGGASERSYARADLRRLWEHCRGRTVTVRTLLEEIREGRLDVPLNDPGPLASFEVRDMLWILCTFRLAARDTRFREHLYVVV